MKKYTLAVRTIENPLPRLCDFVVIRETRYHYKLQSLSLSFWIRKTTLETVIHTGKTVNLP